MYNLPKQGYTVNITKEKFLNTYPPLFNTLSVTECCGWGIFLLNALFCQGFRDLTKGK